MPHTHDHQLNIGGTAYEFDLVRDDQGSAMYQVIEEIPQYQPNLKFTQTDWIGGHGQYAFEDEDKYFEGQSIDTTQAGRMFLAPLITEVLESDDTELDSAPLGFFWFEAAGKWLCWTTGKIYIYGTKWTAATTLIAGVLGMAELSGKVYAARGASTAYAYSTDGDTWTISDLAVTTTDKYASGFLVCPNPAGTAEVIWKFIIPNTLYHAAAPINAATGTNNWSSATYVGETSNNIINIFLSADKLYVGKEDGLYWVDSDGGVHAELPDELRVNHSIDNFKYINNWQTSSYFSIQRGMAEMTTSGTYRPISPLTDIDDIGKVGDIVGITSDKDWLYVAMDEGTNTHIYKGRETLTGGGLRWEWCPWVYLGTNACSAIKTCQHTTTDRRLWFGYGTHTAYVILSDNPLADSAARFCTSGWLKMSYTYGTDPNWDKLWQSVVLEMKRYNSGVETVASSGESVQIKFRDDNDLPSAASTECVAARTSLGVDEVNLTSALHNKRISFEIWLASITNTATPVVTYFQAKGTEKPTTVRINEAYYRIGDKPSERAETIRTLLRTARTSTTLVKFADLRYGQKTSGTASGDYVWCVMMPGFPKEVEVKHEKQRQPELAVQVRLQEVSFTIS